MAQWPRHPAVYEVNTWVWLRDLSRDHGRAITLGNVPDGELERLAELRFDGVWLMGVWERSPASRRIARTHEGLQADYRRALPGYRSADVVGSPYAIRSYRVEPALGGDLGLAALRDRLRHLGLLLMLDFVPNHMAIDHPWTTNHPERLMHGDQASLERDPGMYFVSDSGDGSRVFAHGRDPSSDAWSDTVQLDHRRPSTRLAMTDLLLAVAERSDGVRCDMAILVDRGVFLGTWGGEFDPPDAEFWSTAISAVKSTHPDFLFLGEVYGDAGFELQRLGFDYTYDKRLYDRLVQADAAAVRAHLGAGLDDEGRVANLAYQRHLARFVENHDEKRALTTFGMQGSLAAAVLALTLPGLRLFHEGQLEGRRSKVPVQLGRRHPEVPEASIEALYRRLLAELAHPVFHSGEWRLLEPREARHENTSHRNVVAHSWTHDDECRLVAVNLASDESHCHVPFDSLGLARGSWDLRDALSSRRYVDLGGDVGSKGVFLDMQGHDSVVLCLQWAQ